MSDTTVIAGNMRNLLPSLLSSPTINWDHAKAIIESHEIDRSVPVDDRNGRSVLIQLISRRPPVTVVEAFVSTYPDSTSQNVSAFFAACKTGSSDTVRFLTRQVLSTHGGSDVCPYPWITSSHVTLEGAKILLEEYPRGVLQVCSGTGRCPLDHMILSSHDQPEHAMYPRSTSEWDAKLMLLLEATELATTGDPAHNSTPIHTLLKAVLSKLDFFSKRQFAHRVVELLHRLELLNPEMFRIQDGNGDYPLHVVIRTKCHPGPSFHAARELIILLLQACPEAACFASTMRPCLHVALENGWPCHDVLLMAAPDALQTRDQKTGFFPFQMAACSNVSWGSKKKGGLSSLDVTYSLLREDPCQARG
jgi:hypothetical protein